MRERGVLLLLAALAGCGSDGTGTAPNIKGGGQLGGAGVVTGTVFTVTPAPDSQYLALKDVQVTLYRIGDLPADSNPPDNPPPPPPPGDTMLTVRQAALFAPVFLSDTVVPPPDSTPPPPPPPASCTGGDAVATTTTDGAGKFQVNNLEPGIYGFLFEPPASAGLSPREYCGVSVREELPAEVNIYLWTGPGPDPVPTLRRWGR